MTFEFSKTKETKCVCGAVLDACAGSRAPRAGDFSICCYCSRVSRVQEDMTLVLVTDAELNALPDYEKMRLAIAVALVRVNIGIIGKPPEPASSPHSVS